MSTFDLHAIRPTAAQRERNEQRKAPEGADDECAICGRPINAESKTTRWVECVNGALNAAENTATIDHEGDGYMGCFPVGPTCARKIPARFLVQR